jgi:phospholipase C
MERIQMTPDSPEATGSNVSRRRLLGSAAAVGGMAGAFSPWTVGGNVSSTPLDHTSVLRFLERLTGIQEPNISGWRRRTFGDFTEIFGRIPSRKDFPALPDTSGPLTLATYEASQFELPVFPGARQSFPVQEGGYRPTFR